MFNLRDIFIEFDGFTLNLDVQLVITVLVLQRGVTRHVSDMYGVVVGLVKGVLMGFGSWVRSPLGSHLAVCRA